MVVWNIYHQNLEKRYKRSYDFENPFSVTSSNFPRLAFLFDIPFVEMADAEAPEVRGEGALQEQPDEVHPVVEVVDPASWRCHNGRPDFNRLLCLHHGDHLLGAQRLCHRGRWEWCHQSRWWEWCRATREPHSTIWRGSVSSSQNSTIDGDCPLARWIFHP